MGLDSTFAFEGWSIKYTFSKSAGNQQSPGSTVAFVHGTPWSSVVFQPVAKAMIASGRYSVLLYDLPGYGQSQAFQASHPKTENAMFDGDTSVRFQAAALAALLSHLHLTGSLAPAVIAHDIAGAIALRTHLLHGCDFASLLLMDTNAVLPWGDGFYKMVRAEPHVFLQLPSKTFEAIVRSVIRSACFNPRTLASGWEEALAIPWTAGLDGDASEAALETKQRSFVRQIAQANDEMLDRNLYANVKCPVKIVWGSNDDWIPREKMDRLAQLLNHCLRDFVVIPEAGHLIMIDQPERVTWEIFDWLDRGQTAER
ncbi:Alpha/Beta hydrolase protein [Neohortaea acidophila]|uniref:Alpha/Beta hydrolase protein n=1 Tax=Neohortaea acidophila TaxID=245834 RepID=A0A6A6Q1F8_9PEZI|nr:Alpha/Beta hydrolase protein [Neohortaea acidophila]KAF2485819.1 Alpha/Beta hydrolase protein [Neohortaea acidophila]